MIGKLYSYVDIRAWMSSDENITKNELVIYAYIHGFSYQKKLMDNGDIKVTLGCYTGSINQLAAWAKLSRSTVIRALKSLVEKDYLVKMTYKPHENTDETRCIYYSSVSRIPGRVEELEEREEQKTSLDLLCEKVCESFILKQGNCQCDTGGSVTLEHNKLVNNLSDKHAAADSADAQTCKPPHVSNSSSHTESVKAEPAAAFFNKSISEIFGGNPFDKNFVPEVADRFSKTELEPQLAGDFAGYVNQRVQEKLKGRQGSYTNLFRFLCLAPDVLQDFVMTQSVSAAQESVQKKKYICPVCGEELDSPSAVCHTCGFDMSGSDDQQIVERESRIYRMAPALRNELRNELEQIFSGTGLTLDPQKIREQQNLIQNVYQKYGVYPAEAA